MQGPWLGEFMGTLVLILLGDGVVANVLLKKSKGENSGWIVIATAWGLAVVAGLFSAKAFGSPAGQNNPALKVKSAWGSGDLAHLFPLLTGPILGAFAGASLGLLNYFYHLK